MENPLKSRPISTETLKRKPQSQKQLPRVEPLGHIPINFVKVYGRELIMKASAKNDNVSPTLFLDLERPRPEFGQMDGPELHLGVSASFRSEDVRPSGVKPHIDIYIPASEITRLRELLARVKHV